MGISRISRKKNFRYFSSPLFLSPQTLIPSFCSSYSLNQRSSFCNSALSNSHSVCSFDSSPLHKKHSLPNSLSGFSSKCDSSSGQSSSFHLFYPFSQSLKKLPVLKCSGSSGFCPVSSSFGMPTHYSRRFVRSFSVSSTSWTLGSRESSKLSDIFDVEEGCKKISGKVKLSSNMNSEILEIIKSGNDDVECKLSSTCSELRMESITEIFRVLNCDKISGLRFFRWLRRNYPRWHSSAEVCSRVISNCGCLGDFETMRLLLQEFRSENICLDENAFSFLPLFSSSQDSLMKSVRRLVNLLNEVGGSCRNSGICALIEMFCNLVLFDMAKFVIEITEKKGTHYNILLRQRCKRGHFEEARNIIREMHGPTVKNYNYLLGSLCKNDKIDEAYSLVEEMEKIGVHPDEITFEIFINNSCISGKLDLAKQLLDKMMESRLQPRISTHAAFLKAIFKEEQYEEAQNYVTDSSVKYNQSGPVIYSFLADLYMGKEDLMAARDVIVQMMDKGLRPNFRVYIKVLKQLQKTGRGCFAQDLKNMYSSF